MVLFSATEMKEYKLCDICTTKMAVNPSFDMHAVSAVGTCLCVRTLGEVFLSRLQNVFLTLGIIDHAKPRALLLHYAEDA